MSLIADRFEREKTYRVVKEAANKLSENDRNDRSGVHRRDDNGLVAVAKGRRGAEEDLSLMVQS